MTAFSRYYDENGLLQETTMEEIEKLIEDEKNKVQIANLIYHRYYDRYLKIFDFEDTNTKEFKDRSGGKMIRPVFNMEFKNGFAMMVNCCLVIEALASFYTGTNFTDIPGDNAYNLIFKKASEYGNELSVFENNRIYKYLRNGLLHQGETYNNFKIRRVGPIFDDNTINASKFSNLLKNFLESYQDDLSDPNTNWDGELWDKCRIKLRYIINNTQ